MTRGALDAGLAAAIVLLAVGGPLLAPRDPSAIPDAPALRLLPPLTRVPGLVARSGQVVPVVGEDPADPRRRVFDWRVDGAEVVYRRGPREVRVPLADLDRGPDGQPRTTTLFFAAGTDKFGRDVLSRLLAGARVSLLVGLGGVIVAALFGALFGALAGAGIVDGPVARTGDALLALPRILLVAAIAALFRPGPAGLALVLGLTGWPAFARLVRSDLRAVARSDIAVAARAVGCTPARVALRHLLPHATTTLLVAAGLRVGPFVLLEASLSFLGFGIAPPRPSWGNILAEGRDVLFDGWWVAVGPGLLLAATVVLLNHLADDMRRRAEDVPLTGI